MSKPNFFIIGAPKSGTTSLASWLSEHPQVFMTPNKEPNFFNTDIFTPNRIDEQNYFNLFSNSTSSHKCIGEASTRYLYSQYACKNILSTIDYPKFIVILRNPMEMIYSLHNHLCFLEVEHLKNFSIAWESKDKRAQGSNIKHPCSDPDSLAYGKIGLLGEQIERFYNTVPENQRLTLFFDDLKLDPKNTYHQVLDFLEIENDDRNNFSPTNVSMKHRVPALSNLVDFLNRGKAQIGFHRKLGIMATFNKWSRVDAKLAPIEDDTKLDMQKYFQKDITKLEALSNRDLHHWLKASP